ncbi:hypothetical protein F444_18044, partial [Phytophthora nicotianae P1976]
MEEKLDDLFPNIIAEATSLRHNQEIDNTIEPRHPVNTALVDAVEAALASAGISQMVRSVQAMQNKSHYIYEALGNVGVLTTDSRARVPSPRTNSSLSNEVIAQGLDLPTNSEDQHSEPEAQQ